MIAETIEQQIKDCVDELLSKGEMPEFPPSFATDNLGEVIEKLIILHIRMWMLEDQGQHAKTDQELGEIKRKLDTCFKQKRPAYVQAINRMVEEAIVGQRKLVEDSVKIYKGF